MEFYKNCRKKFENNAEKVQDLQENHMNEWSWNFMKRKRNGYAYMHMFVSSESDSGKWSISNGIWSQIRLVAPLGAAMGEENIGRYDFADLERQVHCYRSI